MKKKILALLVLLYIVVGFFVVPIILKSAIVKTISKETNAKVQIDSIYFNPFTFKLRVNSLQLFDNQNKKLFTFKLFEINLEPHSFVLSAIHLKDIKLQNPKFFLVYDKDKNINFSKILKANKKTKSSDTNQTLPRIIVDNMSISDCDIFYEDYSKKTKFDTSFKNLDFTLKRLDTKDFIKNKTDIKLSFELENDGLVKLKTKLLSLEPLRVDGFLSIKSLKLYTEYKYIKENLNIEIADGELSLNTHFSINLDDKNDTKIDDFNLYIQKFRLKPKDKHNNILTIKSFALKDAIIYPFINKVDIKNIILDSLNVDAKMDKKGQIDWNEYIKTNFNSSDKNSSKEDNKSKKWDISVDKISLKNIAGKFDDKSVKPSVLTHINSFDADINNFNSLDKKPFDYDIKLVVNDNFKCNSSGNVFYTILDISSDIKCSNFDITHYNPYIKRVTKQKFRRFNLDLKKADLSFMANLHLVDENSTLVTYINDANISLDNFKLNKKTTKERLVSFKNLTIKGIKLNTKDKDINITKTNLKYLSLNPKRYSSGVLNIDNLIIPKKVKRKVFRKKVMQKAYRVKLDTFLLQNSQINFRDRVLKPSLRTRLHNINIKLSDIDSKNFDWMRYSFTAKLNSRGYIKAKGKLKSSPLKEKGTLEFKHIRLDDFSPYVEDKTFIKIANGILNLKTKVDYEQSKQKSDLIVDGSLNLDYLFLDDARDNSSIFAINHLDIKSFNYEMNPNKLFINTVDLDSFYINAVINKDKSMNFSHLVKKMPTKVKKSVDTNTTKKPFPIWILQTNIKNGSAGFADHSLSIDFDTQIHNVDGIVYAISSLGVDTSYLDIDGEVDAYGSTKLRGSVNLSDIKNYTDLGFNFRNLSLDSISGYSATFAGYKIDDGKLFLDLKYDIKDSKLNSSNNILIKHIKIGSEYRDNNTTPLPLKFAVALLEDSDGVIDIDMPIVGDIDNPDFKYGSLVMKTFFKLIGNAITSPFRFIGSVLGIDGDKLSFIEFEPAKTNILPSEREKLDNLAKIMIKKPKISISISGAYNVEVDKYQLKKYKLTTKILKKGDIKNRDNHINMMSVSAVEKIYKELVKDANLDKLKEQYKENYKQVLIDKCINTQVVTKEELIELAKERVKMIKDYLVKTKLVNPMRIREKDITISNDTDEKFIKLNLEIEVK